MRPMLKICIRGAVGVSHAQDMHLGCRWCLRCPAYASQVLWPSLMLKIYIKGAVGFSDAHDMHQG